MYLSLTHFSPITTPLSLKRQYSGGQATDGQGGYYGSGGARKKLSEEPHRPELLAMQKR